MVSELALRFVLGGLVVAGFSLVGDATAPKSFAGLFGAAPSVALVSLAMTFGAHGARYAAVEARSMVIGAVALLVYCAACVFSTKRRGLPVWLGAGAAWVAWLGVALGICGIAWLAGAMR